MPSILVRGQKIVKGESGGEPPILGQGEWVRRDRTFDVIPLDRESNHVELVASYTVYPMPISDRLCSLLQNSKETSSAEYVFCDKVTAEPFGSVKTGFKSACRRAGINGLRFHDLRHTLASRLRAKGVDLVTIKELLGHADIRTTMRYGHTNMEAKRMAIAARNGHKSVTEANLADFAAHNTDRAKSPPSMT